MSVAMYLKICSIFYMHRLTRLHSPRIFSLIYNKSFQIVTPLKRFVYSCLFDEFLRFCKYVLNSCLFWLKKYFSNLQWYEQGFVWGRITIFWWKRFYISFRVYHTIQLHTCKCVLHAILTYYLKKNWKSKQFWLNIRRTPETYFLRVFKILHSISNTTEYSH